jgi:hypothetical protein
MKSVRSRRVRYRDSSHSQSLSLRWFNQGQQLNELVAATFGNPSLFGDEASVGLGVVGGDPGAASPEVGRDDEGEEDGGDHSKISRFDFVRYDAPPKEECR